MPDPTWLGQSISGGPLLPMTSHPATPATTSMPAATAAASTAAAAASMPAVTASTLAATVSTPATVASTAAATASTPAAAASMPAVAASTPAVAASMPAATGIPAGALNVGTEVASRKGRAKKPKPALWPGTTVSGKHVCGHEWITNNPGGTKEQFEAFWKSLSKAAKNSFVAQAKALKSSTSSVPSVSQTGTIDSIQSVSQPGAASAVLSQPGAASAVPSQPGAASAVPPSPALHREMLDRATDGLIDDLHENGVAEYQLLELVIC
ncbi:hypothetical protein A0H81_14608 [Grifola frondosa]|uniref:Uncharacterized protein n=1 Tax=Grifola frondosa TaxID=5627 RepID=A0A1C7LRG9_GRIFR|nr:hypothetical protein A0H81_14608 [Grifola frondosa]